MGTGCHKQANVSNQLWYCDTVLIICALRFQYKRYPSHVVLSYFAMSREKRLTTRVAGTSGRAITNDITLQYKHH